MSTLNSDLYPGAWADQRKKQDNMVGIPQVITKLLPSRQIVHFTQQVVYLAHANMHTNHLLVYSGCLTIVNKCYKNHGIVCTFKWKPFGRWSGTVENAW